MESLLKNFILSNEDWEQILQRPPYCLKISRDNGYIIFKYNQIGSEFNNPIVREARGIIFREKDWKCVCRAFDKFGNYGESYCPSMNWDSVFIREKIDGSLIKFWYDEGWHISTNGTINAYSVPLAITKVEGCYDDFGSLTFEIFGKHCSLGILDEDYTYMFELVTLLNRIVIPYQETELYFLGARNNISGQEIIPEQSVLAKFFPIPKTYDFNSLTEVLNAANALPWDKEGYVLCDKNFNRIKIKSPQYVMAHYARNNNCISKNRLIEIILENQIEEFLIYASDYKEILLKTINQMQKIILYFYKTIQKIPKEIFKKDKKTFAMFIDKNFKEENSLTKSYLFSYYNFKTPIKTFIKDWTPNKWEKIITEMKGV